MGTTPVCVVDSSGIHRPTLAACLAYFVAGYQGIYGADVSLGSDTQDGEFMGLLASAVDDCNTEAVSAYNAYSPATAQGTGLSSVVKINGLAREIPSNSSVPVLCVGQQGVTVAAGLATDGAGNQWTLAPFTIPGSGQITATATCLTEGAIQLSSGTVLTITNPTQGWQSATTTANATPGAPVETDPQLRLRQSASTQKPASTMLGNIEAAILAIPGVARMRPYENETNAPDANGIPGFSISIVSDGGDAATIAAAISVGKFACGTYGTTTETVIDAIGVSHAINFFFVTEPPITWGITLTPGPTFSTNTIGLIQASMAAWTNALGIGNSIQLSRAYSAAYLAPSIAAAAAALQAAVLAGDSAAIAAASAQLTTLNAASLTYEITAVTVARDGGSLTAADVTIAFNEAAYIAVDAFGAPVSPGSVTVTI